MGLFEMMALLSLAVGGLLVIKQPLSVYGLPRALEIGLGTLFIFVFVFYTFTAYLVPKLADEDLLAKPCNPNTLEIRCYNITQDSCSAVWQTFQERCEKEAKDNFNPERASALTGPTVKRCIRKSFDKSLKSTRRFSEESDCKNHFSQLDAPSID